MKKLFFALLGGLLAAQLAAAQFCDNERDCLGLRGNVKTFTQEDAKVFLANGKYVEAEKYGRRTQTFDTEGNLIKEDPVQPTEARPLVCVGGKCNTEEPQRRYRYNKQGKIVEELNVLMDGTVTSKREFDYDEQGRTLEWRFYYRNEAGELYQAGKWVYTRRKNEVKSAFYEGCCTLKRWEINVFDQNRNTIESSFFRTDGYRSKSAYAYEYDAAGNWTKRIMSIWVTKDGRSFFEPVEANYRKFTYYTDSKAKLARQLRETVSAVCAIVKTSAFTEAKRGR